MKFLLLIFSLVFYPTTQSQASLSGEKSPGITVRAVMYSLAKFHRYDNSIHPYTKEHAFLSDILPTDVKDPANDNELTIRANAVPSIEKLPNGEYRFFYFTMDQMIQGLIAATQLTHQTIYRLHISGHGIPGGNLFAGTSQQLMSAECKYLRENYEGPDLNVYNQYYLVSDNSEPFSQVYKETLEYDAQTASYADTGSPAEIATCATTLSYWKSLPKNLNLPALFNKNARVNFFTCHQALGKLGEEFMTNFTEILFPSRTGATGEVRAVDTYLANDWSVLGGSVGALDLDNPISYTQNQAWNQFHADILARVPFNLFTARQTGSGVELTSKKTSLMKVE